jgi:hypothetical protein
MRPTIEAEVDENGNIRPEEDAAWAGLKPA